MIAETLSLALLLASAGTPRAQAAIDPQPDNGARARRGLLPRKVVRTRPPQRGRRLVLLPQAPTWLGEPGEVVDPAGPGPDVVVEPAVARGDEPPAGAAVVEAALAAVVETARTPVAETSFAEGAPAAGPEPAPAPTAGVPPDDVADEQDPARELRAVLEEAEVGVVLLRRLPEPDEGEVRAAVTELQLQVLLVRRPVSDTP